MDALTRCLSTELYSALVSHAIMSLFNGNAGALVLGDTAVSCLRQPDLRMTRTPVFGI